MTESARPVHVFAPEVLTLLKARTALLQKYDDQVREIQLVAGALSQAILAQIQEATGVELATDPHELDLERGILRPVAPAATPPVPTPSPNSPALAPAE